MPSLAERSDRTQESLALYQRAHVTMAAAAELVVELTADGTMNAVEAMEALSTFVGQYHKTLQALDGRAGT